jgi:thiol-disulfide isomerase/thioredoxin
VVVVIALIAVIVSALGGDDSSTTASTVPGSKETRPVTVNGTALPTFVLPDPAVGATAPTVTGSSFDGTEVRIEPSGRPQAVAFVAHWCPHCQREVPKLAEYVAQNGLPSGVEVRLVATATSDQRDNYPPSAWLATEGPEGVPVMADDDHSSALAAFGGPSFPFWVFLDSEGKVAGRWAGEFPDGAYQRIFAALEAGELVTPDVINGTASN